MRVLIIGLSILLELLIPALASAQTQTLPQGWSMVGNDKGSSVDPIVVFGNATSPTLLSSSVTSVWTWDNSLSQWNFFTPSMTPQQLSTYATANGYGVLSSIAKGEGFWVNAKSQFLYDPNIPTTSITSLVNTAMYPSSDGAGHSTFVDITLSKQGFIDITTFIASVKLYSPSLLLLDENLTGSDVIQAGTYKLKLTYTATSNTPGNVTIFSTAITPYGTLKELKSSRYNAVGSLGGYSEYYRLNVINDKNIDITTFMANAYIFNVSKLGEDVSLLDNYVNVSGTKFLSKGEYIMKISFTATSNTPGSVTVYIP